jgi:hypothetical protein
MVCLFIISSGESLGRHQATPVYNQASKQFHLLREGGRYLLSAAEIELFLYIILPQGMLGTKHCRSE